MKARKPVTIYPLFWMALAAGAGIVLARYWPRDFLHLGLLSLLFLSAGLGFRGWKGSLGLLLATGSIFQFYAQMREQALPEHHLIRLIGDRRQSGEMVLHVLDLPVLKTNEAGERRLEFTGNAEFFVDWEGTHASTGKVRVTVNKPGALRIVPGQTLRVYGFWERPSSTQNPGEFDYRAYLENKRIYYLLKSNGELVQEVRASRDLLGLVAFHLREHMLAVLKMGLEEDPQTSALMAGMLFGYKEGIAEDLEETFRVTGTLHLFAVSGQNVAVILGMLLVLLQVSGLIRWRWAWMLLPFLLVFCLATGMQSSAARAFVMAALVVMAWAIYRPANIFNVLGAAALFLWIVEPSELFDVGFQLSFFVVLGMAMGTEPFLTWFYQWGKPDPWIPIRLIPKWRRSLDRIYYACCGVVAASLCAWLASQALILYYFHLFAPVTLLANVVVMPLAALVLTASVLSVTASLVSTTVSVILNQVNWLCLHVLVLVVEQLALFPGGHFYVAKPGDGSSREELVFTVFQSRQASPLLIQTGGENWFLDTGGIYTWKSAINRQRQKLGINRLDGIILGQAGADHMASAVDVLEQLPSSTWVESGYRSKSRTLHAWLDRMEEKEVPKQFWRRGDIIYLKGGTQVEVLWPGKKRFSERQEDQGLVLRFVKNGKALLYAGDISSRVEEEILASGSDLKAEVLIQGENSREDNLGSAWLEAVSPRFLIRPERGFNPDRGMNWEKMEELKQRLIGLFQMEETGALQFRIGQDGNSDLRSWSSQEKTFK